jgi:hypothetical protein
MRIAPQYIATGVYCESTNVRELAYNQHVLSTNIDLNPAIEAQGEDAALLAHASLAVMRMNVHDWYAVNVYSKKLQLIIMSEAFVQLRAT